MVLNKFTTHNEKMHVQVQLFKFIIIIIHINIVKNVYNIVYLLKCKSR